MFFTRVNQPHLGTVGKSKKKKKPPMVPLYNWTSGEDAGRKGLYQQHKRQSLDVTPLNF